tara:strand:+ start:39 stop:542 length:504 start_codon:yes stop_codon:yes gene_type:complete
MEQNKFQDGLIYTIKTDNGLYVGSTCDFAHRKISHKYSCFNEKSKEYNFKLYKNIRENGGDYTIEIYKLFPCNSGKELRMQEEEVIKHLNANLNSRASFLSTEEIKEYKKEYQKEYRKEYHKENKEIISQKRKEIITCECGCDSTKINILRHRKTKKHLNLMDLKSR